MKRRKNLTLHEGSLRKAAQLMQLLDHNDLTGLIEHLIRDEWERRNGPLVLHETKGFISPEPSPVPHRKSFCKQKEQAA